MAGKKQVVLELKLLGSERTLKSIEDYRGALRESRKELIQATDPKEIQRIEKAMNNARAEVNKLTKSQRAQVKALESAKFAEGSYRAIQLEVAALTEELRQSSVGINTTQEEFDKLTQRIQEGKVKLADFDRELSASNQLVGEYDRGIIKAFKDLGLVDQANGAINRLRQTQENLNSKVVVLRQEFSKAGEAGSRSANEIEAELKDVVQELQKVNNTLEEVGGDTKNSMEAITNEIAGRFGALGDIVKGGIGGVGAALAVGIVLDGLVDIGEEVARVVEEFKNLRKEVNQLTGVEGEQLDRYTERVKAIASAFDKDVNEVLIATNALSKQMGISFEESFDLIEKGFIAGADVNNEFLDQVREYPAQFKNAGLEAEQMIAIITQSTKEGIFSDKGADTIKEAALRLREFTPATQEAIDRIGLSSVELQRGIEDGSTSIFEAIQQISGRLRELPAQSNEVGTAIADIFGGAGEDAGLGFIQSLSEIEDGLDGLIDSSNIYTSQQIKRLEVEKELAQAQNELSKVFGENNEGLKNFGLSLQVFGVRALTEFIESVKVLFAPLVEAGREIGELVQRFGLFSDRVDDAEGSMIKFRDIVARSPLALFIKGVKETISVLISFIDWNRELASGALGELSGAISDVREDFELVDRVINKVQKTLGDTWFVVRNGGAYFTALKRTVKETFDDIKESVDDVKEGFDLLFDGEFKAAANAFKSTGKDLLDGIGENFNDILREELNKSKEDAENAKEEVFGSPGTSGGSGGGSVGSGEDRIENERDINEKLLELSKLYAKLTTDAIKDEQARLIQIEKDNFNERKEAIEEAIEEVVESEGVSAEQIAEARRIGGEIILQEQENLNNAIKEINERFRLEELEAERLAFEERIAQVDEELEFEESKLNEGRAKGLIGAQEFSNLLYLERRGALEEKIQLLNSEIDAVVASAGEEISVAQDSNAELVALRQKLNEELAILEEERTAKIIEEEQARRDAERERVNQTLDSFNSFLSSTNDLADLFQVERDEAQQEQLDKQRERIEDLTSKVEEAAGTERLILERKLESEKKLYDKAAEQERKRQEEYEKTERRIAITKKAIAVTQATIQTAQAIMQALASLPPPASYIAAAAAGVAGAAQVGAIVAAKFEEGGTLGDIGGDAIGGRIPMGAGEISGRSHRDGGVKVGGVEVEGGELKTNNGKLTNIFKKSVARNPILRKLAMATHNSGGSKVAQMVASLVNQAGGGRALVGGGSFMEDGGVLGVPMRVPNIGVSSGAGFEIVELIKEVNEQTKEVRSLAESNSARIGEMKLVTPVREITEIQEDQIDERNNGLF